MLKNRIPHYSNPLNLKIHMYIFPLYCSNTGGMVLTCNKFCIDVLLQRPTSWQFYGHQQLQLQIGFIVINALVMTTAVCQTLLKLPTLCYAYDSIEIFPYSPII